MSNLRRLHLAAAPVTQRRACARLPAPSRRCAWTGGLGRSCLGACWWITTGRSMPPTGPTTRVGPVVVGPAATWLAVHLAGCACMQRCHQATGPCLGCTYPPPLLCCTCAPCWPEAAPPLCSRPPARRWRRPSRPNVPQRHSGPAVRAARGAMQVSRQPAFAARALPRRLRSSSAQRPLTHPCPATLSCVPSPRYDPQARLIAAWLPQLAALPPELAHQPWAASPDQLAAAGLFLGEPPAAAGDGQPAAAEAAAAGAPLRYYPLPIVDPATQTAKQPKKQR